MGRLKNNQLLIDELWEEKEVVITRRIKLELIKSEREDVWVLMKWTITDTRVAGSYEGVIGCKEDIGKVVGVKGSMI